MRDIAYLIFGSVAGGLSRYCLGGFVQKLSNSQFPYGTLAVNLAGCFLAGLIGGIAVERVPLGASARILLITGFCGAFTTFSALVLESDFLLKGGHAWAGLLNLVLSILLGLAVFRFGFFLGK